MKNFSVTRQIDLHYAHRVPKHNGKCATLHGHRGTVEVTVVGTLAATGAETDMVIDFGDIEVALEKSVKELLCHRTILWRSDPLVEALVKAQKLGGTDVNYAFDLGDEEENRIQVIGGSLAVCVLLPFAPTAERLAQVCYHVLAYKLNDATKRVSFVRFWETKSCFATYPV